MTRLLADPLDKTGFDWKLRRGERQRLLGDLDSDAVELEQDAARLDARHPELRRALARTHAHFQRFLRHRNVRKEPNPDSTRSLHMPRQCAARGLDLPCRDAVRLKRLESELAEGESGRARRHAVDAALM